VEDGIRYILNNQKIAVDKKIERKDINLTINPKLWKDFQEYAENRQCKLVNLLEEGIKYAIKKINKNNY
jgi:hypothetical protein